MRKRYRPNARVQHRKLGWIGTVVEVRGYLVKVNWIGLKGLYDKTELRLL